MHFKVIFSISVQPFLNPLNSQYLNLSFRPLKNAWFCFAKS
uniref:Cj81-004 n=1 Tax=Campylobacter jejuni TaxID=197 RepID=Q50FZ7_CAMJU|nr:Cj81-004 [Campylobacter jejuni subsp. jejuni 81-176]